jgi:Rpp20 subunit of nuclear RNase MRP and P
MSAVKRVKALLREIEKRATQNVKLIERGESEGMRELAEARETLVRNGESVVVKASGRAMEQALRVGQWFRTKEKEMVCAVEVKPGSVRVIDDIVDVERDTVDGDGDEEEEPDGIEMGERLGARDDSTMLDVEGGETTLELLGDNSTADRGLGTNEQPISCLILNQTHPKPTNETESLPVTGDSIPPSTKRNRRKRKKRPIYDEDDVPEQRLRWIKTVEVIISFRR